MFQWPLEQFEHLQSAENICDTLTNLGFQRLSEFYLYRKDMSKPLVISLPSFILLSPNFYNVCWNTANRRLTNVSVVAEISPRSTQAQKGDAAAEIYHGLDFLLEQAMKVLSGKTDTGQALRSALSIIDPQIEEFFSEENTGNGTGDAYNLWRVESRVFIIVNLAEAEALRAWMHDRNGVLPFEISFRQFQSEFDPFDGTIGFVPLPKHSYHIRYCYASLKFFNADIDIDPAQVSMLSRAFSRYKGISRPI